MSEFNKKTGQLQVEKYLPHNFLAEKIVLSSLLVNSETIEFTIQHLTVETFYFKNHQELYKAILVLYDKNKLIDIITLTTFTR